jgi:protein XRP2
MPKSINGQQFIVRNCTDCDVFLLDYSGQVIIENCTNCFVFVAPCESSVYFRYV